MTTIQLVLNLERILHNSEEHIPRVDREIMREAIEVLRNYPRPTNDDVLQAVRESLGLFGKMRDAIEGAGKKR